MTDGDAIVLLILGVALVVTPMLIVGMWIDLRACINRIGGDPRREF